MEYFADTFDVAVIGAGHAGIEAGLAAARLGCKTAVFTMNLDWVGNMACNPSIGGTSKGHLVREIDALGGEMGRAADANTLQSRMLNVGKGPAVHSLRAQIDRRAYTAYMKLPEEYQGQSLKYSLPEESVFVPVMGLGVAGAVLCFFGDQARQQNRTEERKRQLALDYPEVLSRLTIFLGAGMSIRTAWDKIALEYKMMVEQGRRRKRYVYEEMYETSCQMKGGVPEGKAFEEFGRRCGLQSYMKLGGLLEQNRKNGSKNLRNLLRTEMTDAFEQRKHQARRLGEEAGTKLLLPLFILLSVVMVMIAVPALMEFK